MRVTVRFIVLSAVLLLLPASSAAQPPMPPPDETNPPLQYATDTPRPVQPRAELPAAVAERVPQRGIYAAGGGSTSTPWRIVVNFDVLSVDYAKSDELGGASYGDLAESWQWLVAYGEMAPLVTLADAVWREPAAPSDDPSVDYAEIIVLADGDEVRFIQPFGRFEATHARALVDALHALHAPE